MTGWEKEKDCEEEDKEEDINDELEELEEKDFTGDWLDLRMSTARRNSLTKNEFCTR